MGDSVRLSAGYTVHDLELALDAEAERLGLGRLSYWYELKDNERQFNVSGYLIRHIDSYGGEGQGDDYWVVIEVLNASSLKSRYFKKAGYYGSYLGGELDGELHEVFPQEKLVVVWE